MAVDTAEKRFSMMNFGDGTTIHLLPEPDGSIDLDDRQHLLDCYSGVAFGPPTSSNFVRPIFKGMYRGMFRKMQGDIL